MTKRMAIIVAGVLLAAHPAAEAPAAPPLDASARYDAIARAMKSGFTRRSNVVAQAFNAQALILKTDRDPLDVILRRTGALADHLKTMTGAGDLGAETAALSSLADRAKRAPLKDAAGRRKLFAQAHALLRKIAFKNPLLNFDKIIFATHNLAKYTHMCDQYFGFNANPGGSVYVLSDPFGPEPRVRDIMARSVVQNGRYKGKTLAGGSFISLELSYDARTILFAWTEATAGGRKVSWTPRTTYHIFKAGADGSNLVQLTDGPWNDFDPCFLPTGRIMFISERRGGYGRCHPRPVPSYTLHSMNADGSDIVTVSPHETNEWHPSVNNNGMVIYTRWDYVDRSSAQAHHPWITTPDGRDARSIQGNYSPRRFFRPDMEMSLRAIPGSEKLIATACGHHHQSYGSLVIVDPRVEDDRAMSAVRRVTPEAPFPEVEGVAGSGSYGTAWPLDENFTLCVYSPGDQRERGRHFSLCLVDAFGNVVHLHTDPRVPALDPIPLRPRKMPRAIPHLTAVGIPGKVTPKTGLAKTAVMGVMNVYNSTEAMPKGVKITALRIIQVLPKTTPLIDEPRIGYGAEKSARMVLGTVPVEKDGSAHFRAPVQVPIYFQALDAAGQAVQSMRSATYVKPGETLMCNGCHERRHSTPVPTNTGYLSAFKRAPSAIVPDVDGSNPFSFPRLVQPVLDKHCVACHVKQAAKGAKAPDLRRGDWKRLPHKRYTSYRNLVTHAFFYGSTTAKFDPFNNPPITYPGKFGAKASKLYAHLTGGSHKTRVKLTPAEMHRITLWLDCNSDFFGSYENIDAQSRGEVVRPTME